jgi:hypothetical protein
MRFSVEQQLWSRRSGRKAGCPNMQSRLTSRSTRTLPQAATSSFDLSDFRSPLIGSARGSAG